MELKIDGEISGCQRRLTQDEFDQLEQNILADQRALDPIVVWKGYGIIIDGENRHAICQKHSLPFTVHEMEFKNKARVILWLIGHQLGRRNLDSFGSSMLRAEMLKQTSGDVSAVATAFCMSERQVYRDALTMQGMSLLPDDLRQRFEKGGLAATQKAFRKLIDLAEDRRAAVFHRLWEDSECSLDEAITDAQPAAVVMSDRDSNLTKKLFNPAVRRKLAAGTIFASSADMEKLHAMSGDKQVLVADLLETGEVRDLKQAIDLTHEPKKKRSPKADVEKLKARVSETFNKLRRYIDDLGLALGVDLQEVHDAINIAEDNLP